MILFFKSSKYVIILRFIWFFVFVVFRFEILSFLVVGFSVRWFCIIYFRKCGLWNVLKKFGFVLLIGCGLLIEILLFKLLWVVCVGIRWGMV